MAGAGRGHLHALRLGAAGHRLGQRGPRALDATHDVMDCPKGVLPLFVRSLNLLNLAIGQRGKFSKPRLLSFACLSDALRVTRADSGRSIFAARILVLE